MNLQSCDLCPRMCHVNRLEGEKGYCRMDGTVRGARAALHMWEEPCISGKKGSGAVFFSGCTLRCIFCQNYEIADGSCGKEISKERFIQILFELQEQGAANINLVTAGHFAPFVIDALTEAKSQGLNIPVVYNSSGYERIETIVALAKVVDVWLPDFKYMDSQLAKKYSGAENYPKTAKAAIEKMVALAGKMEFDEEGYIQKGVIVRHLILPGHIKNSKAVLQYLYETYKNRIYISVMNQYTPMPRVKEIEPLHRSVTKREYERVLDFAISLGIEKGYFQEGDTAQDSFIPLFNYEGI